jgi:DNA-binding YbaB/EbfC family protein
MAKGFGGMPPMGGGMNPNQLRKQAMKMQKQMEDMQAAIEEKTLEVTSGGGAVKVVINGKMELKELAISPDVVDPDDIEVLQDLVMSAVNEAVRQMNEQVASQMSSLTGGFNIPGGLF